MSVYFAMQRLIGQSNSRTLFFQMSVFNDYTGENIFLLTINKSQTPYKLTIHKLPKDWLAEKDALMWSDSGVGFQVEYTLGRLRNQVKLIIKVSERILEF